MNKRYFMIWILAVSLAIMPALSFALDTPWWNTSWAYRKPINISNTAGNLTNYQINISLNATQLYEAGKLNSSCTDIRLVYYNSSSGNSTELNYWIENCTTNNNATLSFLWVNVTFIQSNTNTTVYMYYGNLSANNVSNFEKVFSKDYEESGLAGLWHLDGNATDFSGNGNNGTLNGPVWKGYDGGVGETGQISTFQVETVYISMGTMT